MIYGLTFADSELSECQMFEVKAGIKQACSQVLRLGGKINY